MADTHPSTNWRTYIPPADAPRSVELANSTAYEWVAHRCAEPFIAGWKESWDTLLQQPYKGITIDGNVVPDLYRLADETEDHGAPVAAMVEAANSVLAAATAEEQRLLIKAVDAPEWRQWLNPEIYIYRHGVRLEETSEDVVNTIHNLMRASLSPTGYYKASGCMKVNQFLGEAVNGAKVLNERSYNFTLFGTPSITEPWGWQISGHHFDMNCFILGTQMTITPVFMGAEPNVIDEGPHKGTELFTDQEQTALKLIHSMDPDTRARVRVYTKLSGPEYPSWRYHRADQRHLCGAFQDNRVIPFEGVKVTTLSSTQQDLVRQLVVLSLNYLPERALTAKMDEIAAHWEETHFSWIGTFERETGFYYKVHSPVIIVEFDHHSGVFLNNEDPLPFHIHTLVRTPNGNDYGREWLRQHVARRTASWPMANPACCRLAPVSAEYEGNGRWEVMAGVNICKFSNRHR
ncbi:hypothetical protein BKA56DRAFT_501126 [Ilyonectria sp. MPI-CAGE-AT-0026]|nr:hypothetical protein BKA56DRAFT_501126 [Ilyonectria sp. MPI-CAGE-AT-0026]